MEAAQKVDWLQQEVSKVYESIKLNQWNGLSNVLTFDETETQITRFVCGIGSCRRTYKFNLSPAMIAHRRAHHRKCAINEPGKRISFMLRSTSATTLHETSTVTTSIASASTPTPRYGCGIDGCRKTYMVNLGGPMRLHRTKYHHGNCEPGILVHTAVGGRTLSSQATGTTTPGQDPYATSCRIPVTTHTDGKGAVATPPVNIPVSTAPSQSIVSTEEDDKRDQVLRVCVQTIQSSTAGVVQCSGLLDYVRIARLPILCPDLALTEGNIIAWWNRSFPANQCRLKRPVSIDTSNVVNGRTDAPCQDPVIDDDSDSGAESCDSDESDEGSDTKTGTGIVRSTVMGTLGFRHFFEYSSCGSSKA